MTLRFSIWLGAFIACVLAVRVIGTRHGEKLPEALLGREEMACAEDRGDYFRVPPDGRDQNYAKFVEQGEQRITQSAHGEDTTRTTPPGSMWRA